MTRIVPEPESPPISPEAPQVSPESQAQPLDLASMIGMGATGDFNSAIIAMQARAGRGDALLPPMQIGNPGGEAVNAGDRGPRVQAPNGDGRWPQAQIHAPELRGARIDTIATQNDGDTVVRAYSNGYQLTQHLRGPLAGAEMVTDNNGRIVRQLETSSAQGPGRPRLEVEYSYGPQQPGLMPTPSSVTLRDARTGRMEGRRTSDDGTITPNAQGFQITDQNNTRTELWHISGTQAREEQGVFQERSMQFVPATDMVTPEGYTFPRGSLVSHHTGKGDTSTTVTSADGRTQQTYLRVGNGPMIQTGEYYAAPREVQHNINGVNQTFQNITSQHYDRLTGNVHLHGPNGTVWTLTNRNGALVSMEKTITNKPLGGGFSPPAPILLNVRNEVAIAGLPK